MSPPAAERTDVLVVGAGPTGLVAALLLARHGLRSIVVEQRPALDEHPRAHELNARSIEILAALGIGGAELAVEAAPMADAGRIVFCRRINEELGRIDLVAEPARREKYERHLRQEMPYLNLSQSELERILVAHVRRSPLVDLRRGHRWLGAAETAGAVRSTVASDVGEHAVESGWLLGCDGAGSPVRKGLGIEMDGPAEIQQFVNAFFRADLSPWLRTRAKLYWIIDPLCVGVFVAHHVERRWVYAVPLRSPWEQPGDFTAGAMRERIRDALGFEVPGLEVESLSAWRMTAQVARSYGHGRTYLLGDAAHRFPPTGGLGMNTGIADAHNLCWKLAAVHAGRAGPALLATYETERRPIAARNCAESHANFDRIFEVVAATGLDPARADLLPRLFASAPIRWLPAPVRRALLRAIAAPARWLVGRALRPGAASRRVGAAIARQIDHFDRLGLDIGYVYGEGALLGAGAGGEAPEAGGPGDYEPSTRPGARLPHAWVDSPSGPVSTVALIDPVRFTLFAPLGRRPGGAGLDSGDVAVVDSTSFPGEIFAPDEALLARPDGHVGWRVAAADLDAASLAAAIDRLLARDGG